MCVRRVVGFAVDSWVFLDLHRAASRSELELESSSGVGLNVGGSKAGCADMALIGGTVVMALNVGGAKVCCADMALIGGTVVAVTVVVGIHMGGVVWFCSHWLVWRRASAWCGCQDEGMSSSASKLYSVFICPWTMAVGLALPVVEIAWAWMRWAYRRMSCPV